VFDLKPISGILRSRAGPLRRFENAAFVETYDPHFAAWLREHARSARIEELPAR
jgi:hypothetical protein